MARGLHPGKPPRQKTASELVEMGPDVETLHAADGHERAEYFTVRV